MLPSAPHQWFWLVWCSVTWWPSKQAVQTCFCQRSSCQQHLVQQPAHIASLLSVTVQIKPLTPCQLQTAWLVHVNVRRRANGLFDLMRRPAHTERAPVLTLQQLVHHYIHQQPDISIDAFICWADIIVHPSTQHNHVQQLQLRAHSSVKVA